MVAGERDIVLERQVADSDRHPLDEHVRTALGELREVATPATTVGAPIVPAPTKRRRACGAS